jgi:hypothetical protein
MRDIGLRSAAAPAKSFWSIARERTPRQSRHRAEESVDAARQAVSLVVTDAPERTAALRHKPPLSANGCTRARFLSDSLISHNSRSARSASASSKGRSCRHCSDHRKSQAGRNSASRHRTRNNLGLDRYTRGAGCDAPCAKPKLSGRKLEGCYSGADDSPAGSRSRASVAPAGYEPAQPARRPAAAIGR